MNKLTPYEHSLSEQLHDLPLPAEDRMWHEMNKLLEDDKDRGPVVPPPSKRGCGLLSVLLLLGIAVVAIYLLNSDDKLHNKKGIAGLSDSTENIAGNASGVVSKVNEGSTKNAGENLKDVVVNSSGDGTTDPGQIPMQQAGTSNGHPGEKNTNTPVTDDESGAFMLTPSQIHSGKQADNKSNSQKTNTSGKNTINDGQGRDVMQGRKTVQSAATSSKKHLNNGNNSSAKRRKKTSQTNARSVATITAAETGEEGVKVNKIEKPVSKQPVSDTITESLTRKSDAATVLEEDTVLLTKKSIDTTIKAVTDTPSVKKTEKKKFHFAAGLAVYQGIPLNGTLDFAVNNSGRKSAITDYIPSIYARFYKDKKWFIQGEFRYGVPQYSKGFTYKEMSVTDSNQNTITSSYKLHKTYYIQIPFSFNYYIMPGWSVGTGIIYNRFTGAMSAETVRKSNARFVNDSLVSFRLVDEKQDSMFRRNSFQWLIETQYQWKRFSFGARYAQGLQPYITYTDPSSHLQVRRKYNSLNLFLRYELWKQKK